MAAAIIIAVVLLLFVASRNSTPREDSTPAPTPPHHFESHRWEKDHFIQKHVHRDDAKHDRHKRNQTPW